MKAEKPQQRKLTFHVLLRLLLGGALLYAAGCTNDAPNHYRLMARSAGAGGKRPDTTGVRAASPTGSAIEGQDKAAPNVVR